MSAKRRSAQIPSPAEEAVKRIHALVSSGARPQRVGQEAERIASEWAGDGQAGRERIAEVVGDLAEAITLAEEQLADLDRSEKSLIRAAEQTVEAIRAARAAFVPPEC